MKFSLLLSCLFTGLALSVSAQSTSDSSGDIRAERVVTVSNQFVVDLFLNGKKVPDSSRQYLSDVFGAVLEQDNIEVKKGDWLVFNVVFSRPRGKIRFFAAAGILGGGATGFVTDPHTGDWSYCDDTASVNDFISNENSMSDNRAHEILDDLLWGDGMAKIKGLVGEGYRGLPLWGKPDDHSVWLKYIAP